jgi:Glu-tRNA(Gln) amidotransferase subunit E-like FAD-binding protein
VIATEEARRFFVPTEEEIEKTRTSQEKARHYYRRVEINALTSEELIVLIEREILRIESEKGLKQPEPSADDLSVFLSEIGSNDVLEEIKKRAIYEVFRNRADVRIDPEAITQLVLAKMKDRPNSHWTDCLDRAIEEYMEELVKELVEELKRSLPNPTGI